MFRGITSAKIGIPIALAALAGTAWWGLRAYQLAQQLEHHQPLQLKFSEAVRDSRDGEVYTRFSDARLDCSKELVGAFGRAFALVDTDGHVAAMIRLADCASQDVADFEGIFREPPYLLYGAAVQQGWPVTRGHLAFLDPSVTSQHAWLRFIIAAFIAIMLVAYLGAIVLADRRPMKDRAWQLRALGLSLLAMLPWLVYMARDYVIWGVIPVPILGACAALVALAFLAVPRSAYMQKVADTLLGPR
jgi:hypothetical protein